MSPGSTARASRGGHVDAVHIAGAVAVPAAGGESELLSTDDRGIVLRVGVGATGSEPVGVGATGSDSERSTLRYLRILNNASVGLAAVQHIGSREQHVKLPPGATMITLGSVDHAAASVQVQIGPIPREAFAKAGAGADGVLSLFLSAQPAGAEVSFLGQAISHQGS